MYPVRIAGIGSYVPEQLLTNDDLEQLVDTSDEWIVTRTGIRERRIAAPEQATSDLAFHAAQAALRDAGLTPEEIDMIIVATSTPDHLFPPVACLLQARLGCRHITAFDVSATCIGFLSALEIAHLFLATGQKRHVLIVGADTLSRFTDYTDRTTCILFGDGAGAFLLSRGEAGDREGILHTATHADGELYHALYVPAGGSRHPLPAEEEPRTKIVMDGRKIFKWAVTAISRTVEETLDATGISKEAIDWLVPHQANQRILEAVAEQLDFPMERVIQTISRFGNNSAATIPLATDLAVRNGQIKRGDLLMLAAFGGGLLWGSALVRY